MRKVATGLLWCSALLGGDKAGAPNIHVVHTSKEVCAYMTGIFTMPCRQAVLVAVDSPDAAVEGFRVSLTFRDSSGQEKSLTQLVMASVYGGGAKGAATFYLNDVTVVSAAAVVVAPAGETGRFPQ